MPVSSTTANVEWKRRPSLASIAVVLLACGIILVLSGPTPSVGVLPHLSSGSVDESFLKWSAMLFYPFTVLRFLSPLESPWLYFDLFHCAVAASGLYLLASCSTGHRWLVLALSLVVIPFASEGFLSANQMAGLVWAPWMLLLAEPAFARGGRDLVLCGGLAAIQLLSGSAEVVALTWICLALSVCSGVARSAWLPIKRLAAFALLAFLIAATQVVPLMDALPILEKSRPSIDVDVEYLDPQGHCLT